MGIGFGFVSVFSFLQQYNFFLTTRISFKKTNRGISSFLFVISATGFSWGNGLVNAASFGLQASLASEIFYAKCTGAHVWALGMQLRQSNTICPGGTSYTNAHARVNGVLRVGRDNRVIRKYTAPR